MTLDDCRNVLEPMTRDERVVFLAEYGHELTILARCTYTEKTSGVTHPRLLRELNEIQHRIFNQIISLRRGRDEGYPLDVLVKILLAEHRPALRSSLDTAFARTVENCQHMTAQFGAGEK